MNADINSDINEKNISLWSLAQYLGLGLLDPSERTSIDYRITGPSPTNK